MELFEALVVIVPLEEGGGVSVQVEAGLLGVVPLVAEDEHDPGVQLGQGGGHVALARLVEDGADEPEIERVAGQGEDIAVRLGSVLKSSAGTELRALELLVSSHQLVLHEGVNEGTDTFLRQTLNV